MDQHIFVGTGGGLVGLGMQESIEFDGSDIATVVRGDDTWWAIADGHVVWTGSPGSWNRTATVAEHRLRCALPRGGGALIGTSEAHLLRITNGGDVSVVDEFDGIGDRERWFTPWGGPPDVRSLASTDEGTLFVNVHVGGILRSEDERTFVPTIDIHSDVHEVITINGTLLAATARGLATSVDGGSSWSFDTSGLHASYCRAVTVADDTVLLSASVGPFGGRAAVYRRPLTAEGGFEKCENGLPEWFSDNIDTGCLSARGSAAAFATSDGRVFSSEDGGVTWTELASGPGPARHVLIA
jgi:hypothetical protein